MDKEIFVKQFMGLPSRERLLTMSRCAMVWWKEHRNDHWTDFGGKDHKTYAQGPPDFIQIAANVLGEKLE